jgi:hypothetical protein
MRHALDALVGQWDTIGESVPDDNEPGFSIKGTDKYEWLPGRKFLVHSVDVWMGDKKVNAVEVIGPCGDDLTAIPMHSFDNGGKHVVMHATQEAPDVWVFFSDDLRARLTIGEGGSSMKARWERTVDGERWQHWLDMRFSRTT